MGSQEIGEVELREYGQTLGVDIVTETDFRWVVEEAFNAPLPASWTEHQDAEGRVYFFQESSNQSSWEHPLDGVYRELLDLVKQVIAEVGLAPETESERLAIVQGHLTKSHQQAVEKLEGWSGPYTAEGGEYYYNAALNLSTWESPLVEWERELSLRHAVLCNCLLPDQAPGDYGSSPRDVLLTALKLPLSTIKRETSSEQPDTPSARSFHTPRSGESARSQRSGRGSKQNLGRLDERRPSSRSSRGLGGDDDGENEFTFGGTNQAAASLLGQNKAAIDARYAQQM